MTGNPVTYSDNIYGVEPIGNARNGSLRRGCLDRSARDVQMLTGGALKRKVLFVCSGNIDRSPTAEALLRGKKGFEAKSAGTLAHAPNVVSKGLIDWADVIFVMEEHHKEALKRIDAKADAKITVLGIEDHYLAGVPELTAILKGKLSGYFGKI